MTIESNEHILLTGAGFTHNFGAPLAEDMWAEIFTNKFVQNDSELRELMLKDFDFESIYNTIIENRYTSQQRKAIRYSVFLAYEKLDSIVRDFTSLPYPVNLDRVQRLINQFGEGKNGKNFFFTVNQDLFIERKYFNGVRPTIPGILEENSKWFSPNFNHRLNDSDYSKLPTKEELERSKEQFLSHATFFYIKLHGSYNWNSSSGTRQMVIGRGKSEQVQKEPLLSWYFEIFNEVLMQPNRRLLVIGYGFGDEHINSVIAEAVEKHGLKIFIISPVLPKDFKDDLFKKQKRLAREIWQGLSGYFPYRLSEIFPNVQSESQACRNIYENFFDQQI